MVGIREWSKEKIIDGKKYTLKTSPKGTSRYIALEKKDWLKRTGYKSVRILWSGIQPHVYPGGRYFVYARKAK